MIGFGLATTKVEWAPGESPRPPRDFRSGRGLCLTGSCRWHLRPLVINSICTKSWGCSCREARRGSGVDFGVLPVKESGVSGTGPPAGLRVMMEQGSQGPERVGGRGGRQARGENYRSTESINRALSASSVNVEVMFKRAGDMAIFTHRVNKVA